MRKKLEKLDDQLKQVLIEYFGKEYAQKITFDAGMDTIDKWDSLSFVGLVVHLEKSFKTKFQHNEMPLLQTVKGIQNILLNKNLL